MKTIDMKVRKDTPFQLTASLEDYLEAIKLLCDADDHGHAHTRDIAKRLKVKMPSVTNALGVLCRNGYINYDTNYPVTLTPLGVQEAKRVVHRHSTIARFLQEILQVEAEEASDVACRMEHAVTEEFVKRMECLLTILQADSATYEALRTQMKQLVNE